MTFQDYVASKRSTKKIPTDILQRWQERIVARGLHKHGKEGARIYLSDYGKGIAAAKCIALARCAEAEGYPDMAVGFWAKAYELETGQTATGDTGSTGATAAPKAPKLDQITLSGLPSHLQPGKIVTMQPVDPRSEAPDWFIKNPEFWGQPKRDGQRLVIIGHSSGNYYQKRTGSVVAAPSLEIDAAISQAVVKFGNFILDTECVYFDVHTGEHRTGAQAATYNIDAGHPTCPVMPTISIFDGLMYNGTDITSATKEDRLYIIRHFVTWLVSSSRAGFEYLVPMKTRDQKLALFNAQKDQGREGEVWFRPNDTYHGGKDQKHYSTGVRTKHLTEREVVVTSLTPTTADGRPFGAIEVAENVNGELVPRGCVGTGYTTDEMMEIAKRFKAGPLKIVVRSQGLTESGQLWLGRFDSIV